MARKRNYNRLGGPENIDLIFDADFKFLCQSDREFAAWSKYAAEWFSLETTNRYTKQTALTCFFFGYIKKNSISKDPVALFDSSSQLPNFVSILENDFGLSKSTINQYHGTISEFLNWVLYTYFSSIDDDGYRVVQSGLMHPFPRDTTRYNKHRSNLDFPDIRQPHPKMGPWCDFAREWITLPDSPREKRLNAVRAFFDRYLIPKNVTQNPLAFFSRKNSLPDFLESYVTSKLRNPGIKASTDISVHNYVTEFLDWVLKEKFSFSDGSDENRVIPTDLRNPFKKASYSGLETPNESVRAPLSIRYINDLRKMVAQGPNFCDWKRMQDDRGDPAGGDWFYIDFIPPDHGDPDCVIRYRETSRWEQQQNNLPEIVTEMWSPVRAVALYLKLELPLRTFQVRMLDSGESDTWRYVRTNGAGTGTFVRSVSTLARGTPARPRQTGVFHRTLNEADAGIYVNTNKTADINKPENKKGYVIPWAHAEVLYWLEKLRNWQERYNPIIEPTPWNTLDAKHFGRIKPAPSVLAERGAACFLFRDAAGQGDDKKKPITSAALDVPWFHLLHDLQKMVHQRGERLEDGSHIEFAHSDRRTTHYPMHSLRVSLISYLVLDVQLPLAVVSKLIAGHSRILMTIYYTKFGKEYMRETMELAERRQLEIDQKNHIRWLKDASVEQLENRLACFSPDAFAAAVEQSSAASFIVEDKGICPVAASMCSSGGEELERKGSFGPVPGWPKERNCPRCRFFLTGPAFLPGLHAHFNTLSFLAHEQSERHNDLQAKVSDLENQRFDCENAGLAFTGALDLQKFQQRYEAEAEGLSKAVNDLQATYHLIRRSLEILNDENKGAVQLVAAGNISDVKVGFYEDASKLHQLQVLCENAVVYPEIDARKPCLERSQTLDVMLEMNGLGPVFFKLTPEQQLAAGNAVMQLIQARTGSLKTALDFVEGTRLLQEIGLVDATEELIEGAISTGSPQRVLARPGCKITSYGNQNDGQNSLHLQ